MTRRAQANSIEIAYDTFGDPAAPPIMLIMGIGCQLIDWPAEFCTQLADRGYWVVRFDNRDVGLSTRLDGAGVLNISALAKALARGQAVQVPYRIQDMADDGAGLIDALGIESAHIVGLSLGGNVAQLMAIHHPGRTSTLTSIMSSTREPGLPSATEEAVALLSDPAPAGRAEYVEYRIRRQHALAGPGYPIDETYAREHAGRRFERGICPAGFARQLAAIMTLGSSKRALQSVTAPAMVIHGDADPLVPVECGIDTANSVPGAELLIIEGMGHQWQHPDLWAQMIDAIAGHCVVGGGRGLAHKDRSPGARECD